MLFGVGCRLFFMLFGVFFTLSDVFLVFDVVLPFQPSFFSSLGIHPPSGEFFRIPRLGGVPQYLQISPRHA